MALLAVGTERAAVDVLVASLATLKNDEIPELHTASRGREAFVTLRTRDLLVESSQWESGPVVRKDMEVFPGDLVMAARAVVAQIPVMRIGMAPSTKRRQPQVRLTGRQVILARTWKLQAFFVLVGHFCRVVTFFAGQRNVLAFERPPCLPVVKLVGRRAPPDKLVLASVVLRVAPGAVCAGIRASAFDDARVIPLSFVKAAANLLVAVQAFQLRSALS